MAGFGDGTDPAQILFEPKGLQGHPKTRRKKREDIAPTLAARAGAGGGLGTDFDLDGGVISLALNAKGGTGRHHISSETFIAHALRAEGFDASEDGTGRGTPLVPVAFALRGREGGAMPEIEGDRVGALRAAAGGSSRSYVAGAGVRRLTPRECARLMGFPDDWARIPWNGKPAKECPDGPQYRSYGNSFPVDVISWIGARMAAQASLIKSEEHNDGRCRNA